MHWGEGGGMYHVHVELGTQLHTSTLYLHHSQYAYTTHYERSVGAEAGHETADSEQVISQLLRLKVAAGGH